MNAAQKITIGGLAMLALVLTGCPGASDPAAVVPTTVASATELLASIPDMASLLPKSLQAGATVPAAVSSSRAVGDVTQLNPDLLPGVTANGYYQVKEQMSNSMFKQVLELLKLGIAGKDIDLDTDYILGTVDLPDWMPGPNPDVRTMDLGVIRLSKPSSEVTEIKWFIMVFQEMDSETLTIPYYLFIRITGTEVATMKAVMAVSAQMTMDFGDGSGPQTLTMKQVSSYDAATKEMSIIMPPGGPNESGNIMSVTSGDGYVKYYNLSDDYKQVAYANDTMGGVVNSSTWDGNSSIWNEYYNEKGDLVMSQWGQPNLDGYNWVGGQFTGLNAANFKSVLTGLAAKPASVYRKTEMTNSWDSNTQTGSFTRRVYWSSDKTVWTEDVLKQATWSSNDNWPMDSWVSPVWMEGDSPAAGDSLYYQQNNEWTQGLWSDNGAGVYSGSWSNTDTYKIGFTMPSLVTYLGNDYFINNRFMLKYLTLVPELAADFTLKMKEGETWYGYRNSDGEWTNSATKPADWDSIDQWDRSSWTGFTYWLENSVYVGKTDADVNSADTFDQEKGDLPMNNLREDSFYLWENGTGKQVKAQVMDTTESEPVGFTFGATALVTTVKAAIEDYYANSVPAFDSTLLQAQADAILIMPDTASFPTY